MAHFRVVATREDGEQVEYNYEYQRDAEDSFFEEQNDDNDRVELFNVWSTGSTDLVEEWHHELCNCEQCA